MWVWVGVCNVCVCFSLLACTLTMAYSNHLAFPRPLYYNIPALYARTSQSKALSPTGPGLHPYCSPWAWHPDGINSLYTAVFSATLVEEHPPR